MDRPLAGDGAVVDVDAYGHDHLEQREADRHNGIEEPPWQGCAEERAHLVAGRVGLRIHGERARGDGHKHERQVGEYARTQFAHQDYALGLIHVLGLNYAIVLAVAWANAPAHRKIYAKRQCREAHRRRLAHARERAAQIRRDRSDGRSAIGRSPEQQARERECGPQQLLAAGYPRHGLHALRMESPECNGKHNPEAYSAAREPPGERQQQNGVDHVESHVHEVVRPCAWPEHRDVAHVGNVCERHPYAAMAQVRESFLYVAP